MFSGWEITVSRVNTGMEIPAIIGLVTVVIVWLVTRRRKEI